MNASMDRIRIMGSEKVKCERRKVKRDVDVSIFIRNIVKSER